MWRAWRLRSWRRLLQGIVVVEASSLEVVVVLEAVVIISGKEVALGSEGGLGSMGVE
jgi:hypothetical protein